MKPVLIFILIVILALPAFGEEAGLSEFLNPPVHYVYSHTERDAIGEEVNTQDELLIGDRDNRKLTFWFYITGPNYHACSMAGIASATKKKNIYKYVKDKCSLTIQIENQDALLSDPNDECKKIACGMYAVINGIKFLRMK